MAQYPRANPAKWWRTRSVGAAHRSPAAMFISPLRQFTTLGLLVFLITLIGGVWFVTNPARISRMAQILLSDVLGGEVEVGGGRLSFAGTLELTGVKLRTSRQKNSPVLFSADQVKVRFDWLSLLSGELHATQITATRPTLNLVEDTSSQVWNYEGLQPRGAPRGGGGRSIIASLPVILLREARVQWAEVQEDEYVVTGVTVVDGQLSPDSSSPRLYTYTVDQRPEPAAATEPAATEVADQGVGQVRGTWDVESNRFTATLRDIHLSPGLEHGMPRPVRQWCQLHGLDGGLKALQIDFDPDRGLLVKVDLNGVSLWQPLHEFLPEAQQNQTVHFDGITGALTFDIKRGQIESIELWNLQGQAQGYAFGVEGRIGAQADSPFDLTLRLPDARIGETYPEIFRAFNQTQDLLYRLRPRGLFDVSVQIQRTKAEPMMKINGNIDCKDVAMRFIHFPYPLQHLRGRAHFDNETLTLDHLSAQGDENTVTINGSAGITAENHSVDILVSTDRAYVDERVAACLPKNFQPLWALFDPRGFVQFACRVTRGPNLDDSQSTLVDIHPLDVQAQYREFPYPLNHVRGHVVIRDEITQIENLTARAGPGDAGEVTFAGNVVYPEGDIEKVQPDVKLTAKDLPLDRSLMAALPEEHRQWSQWVDMTGPVNFVGNIHADAAAGVAVSGDLSMSDVNVLARDGQWAIHHINARLAIDPKRIEISHLDAKTGPDGAASLVASGVLDHSTTPVQLHLQAQWEGMLLEPKAPAFLPDFLAKMWKEYQPKGILDGNGAVTFNLLGLGPLPPGSAATEPTGLLSESALKDYTLELRPRSLTLAPSFWPDPFENITGSILWKRDKIELADVQVQTGPARMSATGTYSLATAQLELSDAHAKSPELPERWIARLPANAAKIVTSFHPEGGLAVDLTQFRYRPSDPERLWDSAGSLTFAHLKTTGPLTAAADEFTLTGSGGWSVKANGLDFNASLESNALSLNSKAIKVFTAKAVGTASEHTVVLNQIDGRVADGVLQGNILVSTTEDHPRYEATFVLSGAELGTLVLPDGASEEERKRVGTGRVTANLSVQETFGDQATRSGRGDLVVRDGPIYNVPLAMGLMQLATLQLPVSRAFSSAQMSYYIRDNKVSFEKIMLESSGLTLGGLGTLSLKDKRLDMRFVTESTDLPWFGLVDMARHQLLQIEVTGTVEAPKITPVPLDAISSALRLLLPKAKPAGE